MKKEYKKHPLTENRLETPFITDLPEIDLIGKEISIFTIGPVQSFIATAKKVKEFWAGSYLLSFLIWQAIEHTINKAGENSIIFPSIIEQPFYKRYIENQRNITNLEMPTLPNRFMAVLDKGKAKEILGECEEKVKDKLFEILQDSMMDFNFDQRNVDDIKNQIDKLLEIYWVSIPIDEDLTVSEKKANYLKNIENNKVSKYSIITSLAEELLGSRKNFRKFDFVKEKGVKCFICGERSALVEVVYEEEDRVVCGVCALKRSFEKYFNLKISNKTDIYYPSVIEIATMDYKKSLLNNLIKDNLLDEILQAYAESSFDNYRGKLLSRWRDRNDREKDFLKIKGDYFDLESSVLKDSPEIKSKLSYYNEKYNLKFNKYYALIYLDGDNMGKWVSGEFFEKNMTPKLHAMVSKALTNYSLKFVKNIIEKNGRKGKVVYAGGDDVVAFVNLDDLFTVMRELNAYFSGSLKNGEVDLISENGIVEFEGNQILTLGPKATISMGVCIAHYKEPLNLIIKKAHQMETKAKENKIKINNSIRQKDAFAIGLIKNSGEIREAEAKWIYNKIDLIDEAIQPLINIIRENKISRDFIYILKEELKLIDQVEGEFNLISKIVKSEIKRLVQRKAIDLDKKDKNLLIEALRKISLVYEKGNLESEVNNLNNFIFLLEIIFFIGKRGG